MAHPSVTKRVIKRCTRIPHVAPPKELDDLTERELDVFRLIARGPSNAEIGQELHQRHDHITHILQKLDLRDRVQAIVLVYQTGLADTDACCQVIARPRVTERSGSPLSGAALRGPIC